MYKEILSSKTVQRQSLFRYSSLTPQNFSGTSVFSGSGRKKQICRRTALTLNFSNLKMTVFWNVVHCGLVKDYRRFRCARCLDHQSLAITKISALMTEAAGTSEKSRLHGATSKMIAISIIYSFTLSVLPNPKSKTI